MRDSKPGAEIYGASKGIPLQNFRWDGAAYILPSFINI